MRRMQVGFLLIVILFALLACDSDTEERITSMKDLKVKEMFGFHTVKPVALNLSSIDEDGEAMAGATFTIMRSGSRKVLSAITDDSGKFEYSITVPSYENVITLISGEHSSQIPIPSNGEVEYSFMGSSSKVRSFSYFTPAENAFASLCFEDLWPSNGDYDVNDLVLDLNVEQVYNSATWELTNIIFKYKVRAIGARKTIGFAITLPEYIVADGLPSSSNTEASWDATNNTIVFFNNARNIVSDDPQQFFNADHSIPHNYDSDLIHEINLPVYEDWWKSSKMVWIPWYDAPFNPFIFVDNNPGHQIHLKHYPVIPGFMDMGLFNQEDDNSEVSYPDYPQSFQNFNFQPWAFYIAESISYPQENRSIIKAFPDFAAWALSEGWDHADWYLNPDAAFIYDPNH